MRLPGPAAVLPGAGGIARRRRADRLGRAAPQRRAADPLPGLPRRLQFRAEPRPAGGPHHSGNWGGLLRNPGTVLASAIASMVDARGAILVDALRPPPIPEGVRAALADIRVGEDPTAPTIDTDWGEPGLTPAERVFAWNTLEVLAFKTGDPDGPLNAVPPHAKATLQLRFVVGTDWQNLIQNVRAHLDAHGFPMIEVRPARAAEVFQATRLPWRTLGSNGRSNRSRKAPERSRRCCPISAARCRTTPSRKSSASRPSGCRILPGLPPARARRAPARLRHPRGAGDHGRSVLGPGRGRTRHPPPPPSEGLTP